MEPTNYYVKFKLKGDPDNVAYRTLTFTWRLTFKAASARILNIIENRYGDWTMADIFSEKEKVRQEHQLNFWVH